MNLDLTIKELQRMFTFFNDRFYDGLLHLPVLLTQTNGRHKDTLGWCTTKRVWNNEDGSKSYYEITISAEHLNRPIEEIIATLLHEMFHLYNLQNNIKDTSRGGSYHNKTFKKGAEKKGLIIDYDKRTGWSLTKLNEDSKHMICELKPSLDLFKLARSLSFSLHDDGDINKGDEEKPKSSMRKYVCPGCDTIIRATKDVNVLCGDCNLTFEIKE